MLSYQEYKIITLNLADRLTKNNRRLDNQANFWKLSISVFEENQVKVNNNTVELLESKRIIIANNLFNHTSSDIPSFNVDPSDLSLFIDRSDSITGDERNVNLTPITNAPPTSELGGVIYFGKQITKQQFNTLLSIFNIPFCTIPGNATECEYSLFHEESKNISGDLYINQLRLVSDFGMEYLFKEKYTTTQKLTISEILWIFIQSQIEIYANKNFQLQDPALSGVLGGDGDNAIENLSFGFTVESDYYNVYRIWSRPYLITK